MSNANPLKYITFELCTEHIGCDFLVTYSPGRYINGRLEGCPVCAMTSKIEGQETEIEGLKSTIEEMKGKP